MNLPRLNHALIPESFAGRERLRRSWPARLAAPLVFLYTRLTMQGRMLLLLTLVVGAFGLQVETTQVYLVFSLMAGLCVTILAFGHPFALSGVTIQVRCPRRVCLGETQHFDVELANHGNQTHRALTLVGPFLPSDGRWLGDKPVADELRPDATVSLTCAARFTRRGEHHLDPFTVAAMLPLGLSCGQAVRGEPVRFMVVPAIAPVIRLALPLARRHQPGGVALASKTGESMDLLGIRAYRPGDRIRDLHAPSWARTGLPMVREYQEEYFSRVGVVVDTDAVHAQPRRLEAALSLAAGIVARLSRGEALIDLLVVGDDVHALTLGRSLGFLDQALDLLACVQPGRAFDGQRLVTLLAPFLGRLSAVVLVGLTWDSERALFVQMVRGQGVACQAVVVHGPRPADIPPNPNRTTVPVEAIERKEPLCL